MPAYSEHIHLDNHTDEYQALRNNDFLQELDFDAENDADDDDAASILDQSRLLTSTPMRRKPDFIASYVPPTAISTSNEVSTGYKFDNTSVSDLPSRPTYTTKYLKRQEPQPEPRFPDRLSPIPIARSNSISPAMSNRYNLSGDRARIQALAQQNPLFNEMPNHFSHRQRHSLSAEGPRPMYNGIQIPGSVERKGSRLGSVHSRTSSLASNSRFESPSSTSINSSLFRSFSPDLSDDTISPLARQLSARSRSRVTIAPPILSPSTSPILERDVPLAKDLSISSTSTDSPVTSETLASPEQTERQLEIVEMDIQQTRRTYEKLKERLDLQVKLRESLAGRANATLNQPEIVEDLAKSRLESNEAEKPAGQDTKGPEISKPNRLSESKQPTSTISKHKQSIDSKHFSLKSTILYTFRTVLLLFIIYSVLNFVDYYICLQEANKYRAAGFAGSLTFNGKLWPPPLDRLFEDPD